MDIHITDHLDERKWREFVDQNPQGNIFHTPEMFQVFSRAKGYRPQVRAACGKNGEVLALLVPVQVTLRDGLMRRLTTRSIAYGSILCAPGESGQEALQALLQQYTRDDRQGSLFTELRHLSDLTAYHHVFRQCGFSYQDHLNYLIDLDASPEVVFNQIGARTRKHIRRELKKGQVVVEEVHEPGQVKIVYDLIQKSYQAARVPTADFSLFEAAFEILHPREMVKFLLVRFGDTYIASSAELVYKDVIYGWYSGVDRAFSNLTPNEMLMWHILKWGAENGYRMYDFGGAGNPDEKYGVRDFKAKFGGRLVCFGRNTIVHQPALLRLSTLGYSLLRRFNAV